MLKRLFDLIAAAAGLVLLAPLLAVAAIMVRRSSPGPLLFHQERVGKNGQTFKVCKFRTMYVLRTPEQGSFEAGTTARVTPIGRLLRKWKVDELPQLWNVLMGDMALVGPRPEVRKWVDSYPAHWARVLTVRPGITDPASIIYRNEEEILAASPDPERTYREVVLPHKLDLYEHYVRTRSFWGDVGILFRTVGAVLSKTEPDQSCSP
jgi:lipopolysaccharide/colanic/teichoic acid biosynthesis glycosyltransferase